MCGRRRARSHRDPHRSSHRLKFGQGVRGAEGAAESGSSELVIYQTDPVYGVNVAPEHAESVEYQGHRYYFDSADCKRRFEESPERYTASRERRAG